MSEDTGARHDDDGVPKELVLGFWTLVLFTKVAVLAIGLGAIFLVFTDLTILGLGLLGVGAYVVLRWTHRYRHLRRNHDLG